MTLTIPLFLYRHMNNPIAAAKSNCEKRQMNNERPSEVKRRALLKSNFALICQFPLIVFILHPIL